MGKYIVACVGKNDVEFGYLCSDKTMLLFRKGIINHL